MKTPNKTLIAIATVASVAAPIVPKTVNITINEPQLVATVEQCKVISMIIDDKGNRICEYRCGNKIVSIKSNESSCENTIRNPSK